MSNRLPRADTGEPPREPAPPRTFHAGSDARVLQVVRCGPAPGGSSEPTSLMGGYFIGWTAEDDEDVSIGSDGELGEREQDPEEAGASTVEEACAVEETDNVCSLCHDGGDLLACDGPCGRSFHPTLESGPEDGECPSLGMSQLELDHLTSSEDVKFFCGNCEHKMFQCFKCKVLGRLDREVFRCQQRGCGKFYHMKCLNLLEQNPIVCPLHRCHSRNCKGGGGRLIRCRLCPRAWHVDCVPKYISFEEDGDTPQRGWKLVDEESGEESSAFVFCGEHDYELNRRGKPSYKNLSMVLFPGQAAGRKRVEPRFVHAAREWKCAGCFKQGFLNLVLKNNRVFATCRDCETAYWVNPNKDGGGRLTKYGGKFTIINRPKKQKR